jgi:branched-chain amino acid transport system substrate-binding protein
MKLRWLVIGSALALTVSACTGGAPETRESPAEGSPTAAPGDTIKIAFTAPLTGDGAGYGVPALNAVKLAVALRNEAGGVLGRKVELASGDTEAKAGLGAVLAQRFCDDESILGSAGFTNSWVTIAATAITHNCDSPLPVVVGTATNPRVTDPQLTTVFRVAGRDDIVGPAVALAARDLGLDQVAAIDDGTAFGRGLADEFVRGFEAVGGSITTREGIRPGDKEFRTLLLGLPESDGVFYGGLFTEAALIVSQMREIGLMIPLLGGDGLYDVDLFIKASGGAAYQGDGSYSVAPIAPPDVSPAYEEFKKAWEPLHGEVFPFAPLDFDAANIVMDAIQRAGEQKGGQIPTRADVTEALTKMPPYQGATFKDPIRWDPVARDNLGAAYYLYKATPEGFDEVRFFSAVEIKKVLGG